MLVAIGVFRASGAMGYLAKLLAPLTELIGMPAEVLPMAIMRPLSGGGANGIMNELFKVHGPDSLIGRMASIMSGATDTTFYVLAVYDFWENLNKTINDYLSSVTLQSIIEQKNCNNGRLRMSIYQH